MELRGLQHFPTGSREPLKVLVKSDTVSDDSLGGQLQGQQGYQVGSHRSGPGVRDEETEQGLTL